MYNQSLLLELVSMSMQLKNKTYPDIHKSYCTEILHVFLKYHQNQNEIPVNFWSTSLKHETKPGCFPLPNVLVFKTFKTINDFSKLSTKLFCQYPFMRNDLYPLTEPNLFSSLCFLWTFLDLIIWKNCSSWQKKILFLGFLPCI